MTVFESKILLDKPANEVYSFLEDLNNHEVLMPDNIYNWTSTKDEASFTIQNMAKLSLKVDSKVEHSEIYIVPAAEAPIALSLRWILTNLSGEQTEAKLIISAELNMMMKMLASGPLQKLVDFQTKTLKEKLS